MRFKTAQNRFTKGRIVNLDKGRALGNGTYLRKLNDDKYEIWAAFPIWVQNENGNWIRSSKESSLFTIEPYGDETLLTITNTRYNDRTASCRLWKWTGVRTCICDKELRFFPTYDDLSKPVYSLPALTEGVQFIVNSMGNPRLKEGQPLRTSVRYVNKDLAKPIQENYNKLLKFGQMLTAIEAVTYADTHFKKSEPFLSDVKKVLKGEIEPTIASVCEVLWQQFWYKEKSDTSETVVEHQRTRFERGLRTMKKMLYKEIGAYEPKPYKV
jgi:hypothetical protein